MNVKDSFQNKNFRVNPDDHFVFSIEELKQTAFAPTDLICGHLHTRQVFEGIKGGYVGALSQNNFGEEHNPAGYLRWNNGNYGYRAFREPMPEFHNTTEEVFLEEEQRNPWVSRDYYKFTTANPEKYSGFANVVCVDPESAEITGTASAFDGRIELSQLIEDYCKATNQEIPQLPFLLNELEKISLSIVRSQTGLDFVDYIHLRDVGPNKKEIIHKDTMIEFGSGLNAITGKNGTGKSLAIESILSSLYGSYVERGALKNYCHGSIDVGLMVGQGEHHIENRPNPKGGLVAYFDGVECKLKGALATEVVPRFGDSNVFESVVFMDQGSKKDLVEAGEAKRLEILSKLLNLEILEEHRKVYAKQAKDEKAKFDRFRLLSERQEEKLAAVRRLTEALTPLSPPDTVEIMRLENLQENRRQHAALFDRYESWLEIKGWLERNPGAPCEQISILRNRKERCYVLQADIARMEASLSQKGIGCGPNFLPCSLLRGAKPEDLAVLKEELAQKKLDEEDHAVLARQEDIERKLAQLHTKKEAIFDQMPEKVDSVESVDLQLKALKADRDLYLSVRRELDWAQEGLRKVQEELSGLGSLEEAVRGYEFLESLCSKKGLPLYVISSIVVGLQKQLDEITTMAELDLKIKISLSKEEGSEVSDAFDILYSRKGRSYAKVKFSSGGERTMIRVLFKLALMLYLNKYFGNYKVLIMDEPEKGLDVDNLNVLMTLLSKLKGRLNQVIVITHNQQIESIADNVIRL